MVFRVITASHYFRPFAAATAAQFPIPGILDKSTPGSRGSTPDSALPAAGPVERDSGIGLVPSKRVGSLNDSSFKEEIKIKFQKSRDERVKLLGESQSKEIEKRIFLQSIDMNWKSHIQYLEQLRQVIGLRSYGQRDPLVEYKKEAFNLFENLLNKLKLDFITILMNLKVIESSNENKKLPDSNKIDPKYIGKKMGRNEPCFCGSGKKYKHCCGAL